MRLLGWFKGTASQKVLRVIVMLTVVLYLAFFLIGYNHPFAEDPDFIEPKLTPVLMGFVLLVVLVALGVTIWAMLSSMRKRGTQTRAVNGLPTSRITVIIIVLTLITMLVSYWAGSTAAITVNGKDYTDVSRLRLADMFVITSLALMLCAALAVAISAFRSHFRKQR